MLPFKRQVALLDSVHVALVYSSLIFVFTSSLMFPQATADYKGRLEGVRNAVLPIRCTNFVELPSKLSEDGCGIFWWLTNFSPEEAAYSKQFFAP